MLVGTCGVCLAVIAGAVLPDLDHLVAGLARQTHVHVAVAGWLLTGGYVALAWGLPRLRVLTRKKAVET